MILHTQSDYETFNLQILQYSLVILSKTYILKVKFDSFSVIQHIGLNESCSLIKIQLSLAKPVSDDSDVRPIWMGLVQKLRQILLCSLHTLKVCCLQNNFFQRRVCLFFAIFEVKINSNLKMFSQLKHKAQFIYFLGFSVQSRISQGPAGPVKSGLARLRLLY